MMNEGSTPKLLNFTNMTRLMLKRFVFIVLLAAMSSFLHAQVISASVGVNGLTCSQCSRSVEMQLRKLPFVKTVTMNLKQTEGSLEFKDGAKVDFSRIAEAVKNAGFSVRFLTAEIDMGKVSRNDKGFKIGNDFYFVSSSSDLNNLSVVTIRFLGKTYSSDKKNNSFKAVENGYNVEIISNSKKMKIPAS